MPISVRCLGEEGWYDVEVPGELFDTTVQMLKESLSELLDNPIRHFLFSNGPRHLWDESKTLAEAFSGDGRTGGSSANPNVMLTSYSDLLDGSIYGEAVKMVGAPPRKIECEMSLSLHSLLRDKAPRYGYVDDPGFFPRCPNPKQKASADDPLGFIASFDSSVFSSPWDTQALETSTSACCIPDTAHRGVSLLQLRTLLAFVRRRCRPDGAVEGWVDMFSSSPTYRQPLLYDAINLYQTADWIIKPATRNFQCSYVELVAKSAEQQMPKWFVSHAWAESILRFIICVERHFYLRELLDSDCVWICAYANNQHELGADLVQDPSETSFFRAMRLCAGVLLILDENASPFRRIWCCFEEAVALSDHDRETPMMLDIATVCGGRAEQLCDGPSDHDLAVGRFTGPGYEWTAKAQREDHFDLDFVIRSIPAIDIEAADASHDIDKWRILNFIAGRPLPELDSPPLAQHKAYQDIGLRLRAHFALAMWRKSCGAGIPPESKDIITQAFCDDTSREHLRLSFRGSLAGFDNLELQRLAKALPARLQTLRLDLAWCNIGCTGTAVLGKHLSSSLKVLSLTFEESIFMGDVEPSEEQLVGHMYRQALSAIVEYLPERLEELTLSCTRCDGVADEDLQALGKGLPSSLRKLELTLASCKGFSDKGMKALANGLPKRLNSFSLNMQATMTISEASAVALVKCLPKSLEYLFMSFYPGILWRLTQANGVRLSGQNKIQEWRRKTLKAVGCSRICCVM